MEILVISDLYNAGLTEDGREYHAEVFAVQAEAEDGRRWIHRVSFKGCRRVVDCDYVGFEDLREIAAMHAETLANRVRAHLANGGALDFSNWSETDPAYGSAAFQALDSAGYFKDRERREAE